jgi:hypothetical protein
MNSKDDISNSLEQLTISPKGCKIVSSNTNGTRTTLSLHFFDPGECVEKYLDEDGRIIQLLQLSECVSDIDMSETYKFQVSISDPQSETTQASFQKFIHNLIDFDWCIISFLSYIMEID